MQNQMFRRMVGMWLFLNESPTEFMIRSNKYLKELRESLFKESWSETYTRSVYRWAGHVARLSLHDPQRLTLHVLYYKNYAWILNQSVNGNQGHGRRLRIWRWETNLYKALGPAWQDYAFHRDTWDGLLDTLVKWRASDAWNLPYSRATLQPPPPPGL